MEARSLNSPAFRRSLVPRDVDASCHQLFVFLFLICLGGCVDLLNLAFVVVNRRQINKMYNFTLVFNFAHCSCESRREKPPKLTQLPFSLSVQ